MSAYRMSTKLLTSCSGLHVSAAMRLKESKFDTVTSVAIFVLTCHLFFVSVQATKESNKLVIQGVHVPSPRTKYLVQSNNDCSCPLSALNLNVKHTVCFPINNRKWTCGTLFENTFIAGRIDSQSICSPWRMYDAPTNYWS